MTSQYTIIIKNMSSQVVSFYAFQGQASFSNAGGTPAVLSSSLACGSLAPSATSGSQLNFGFDAQNFVGAKSKVTSSSAARAAPTPFNARISMVGSRSATSDATAVQPIDLTTSTPGQSVDNFSTMSVNPLGLSAAQYQTGLDAGCFGVQIPPYTPGPVPSLYCGCAAINQDGSITLSSFISPLPNSQVCCTPSATYYVKVGSFSVGQVITYDTSLSAACNFALGYSVITVKYNNDGSFTTQGS